MQVLIWKIVLKIKKMYEDAYKEHGDSIFFLTPKGKNEIILKFLRHFLKW